MIKEVERYMNRCNTYQRNKNRAKAPVEKLILNMILEKP